MAGRNWIAGAIKHPGSFTREAKAAGMSVPAFAAKVTSNPDRYSGRTRKRASLARTLTALRPN